MHLQMTSAVMSAMSLSGADFRVLHGCVHRSVGAIDPMDRFFRSLLVESTRPWNRLSSFWIQVTSQAIGVSVCCRPKRTRRPPRQRSRGTLLTAA